MLFSGLSLQPAGQTVRTEEDPGHEISTENRYRLFEGKAQPAGGSFQEKGRSRSHGHFFDTIPKGQKDHAADLPEERTRQFPPERQVGERLPVECSCIT
jgi:hypothetical protein